VGLPPAFRLEDQEHQGERQADVWHPPPLTSRLEGSILGPWDGLSFLSDTNKTVRPAFTVALCVTSFNRIWQLRRALPLNLLHCWPHRDWVRIHLVDFGSTDGSLGLVQDRCRVAIQSGLL